MRRWLALPKGVWDEIDDYAEKIEGDHHDAIYSLIRLSLDNFDVEDATIEEEEDLEEEEE